MTSVPNPSTDPFGKFWSDMMSQMGASGSPNPFGDMQEDATRRMRRVFLDAWAKSCEEYLGSPQFLDIMKQSMDGALAFRKQMNEFLAQAYEQAQVPSRDDMASLSKALHGFEERIVSRIENLSDRVALLEEKLANPSHPAGNPKDVAKVKQK